MSYTPKTEDQLAKEGLLAKGTYDFEVAETSDKPSKKGNDMYTLKLHVFDENGTARIVYDYIALGNNFGERKLRHAADTCGLIEIYNTGNLKPKDFQGKSGKAQIKQQDGTVDHPMPKNVVSDYVKKSTPESVSTGELPKEVEDDEVPF